MRRALIVLPAVLLLGLLGVGLFRTRQTAQLGRPAPDFSLRTLRDDSGARQRGGSGAPDPAARASLRSLRGRPVVLNFWASWCEPCKDEAPELERAHRAFGDRVAFLGVSILDGRDEGLRFQKTYGITYPSAWDPSGSVSKAYAVTGVPETVFIDAEGRVVGKFIGAFSPGRLEPILRDLLALRTGGVLRINGRGETRPVP